VFQIPPQGTINLHASLLPQYRGPAPINWALIQGEKETGVTIFYIEEQVDTGNIILQKKTSIGPEETAGELHDRLAVMGAELLVKSIDLIEQGKAPRLPQEGPVSKAPKITREICQIDWNKDAISIFNLVRGVSPSPGAFTFFNGRLMKIHRVKVEKTFGKRRREPGQIVKIDLKRGEIQVATGQGSISILELQPEGKRQMTAEEFLRGHRLQVGEQFG
ncbi:MAG: formyltransferase family protein, partial [candidate division KSB1 bacterium]|nr:formyltransferase family protein [candidate division KSB1 bacterium]